jgi:glucose/arabinose dehydrogenase
VCEVVNYRGKKETRPEGDRILVLEDTDGDGRADRQTVFHQGRDVDSALGRSEPRATVCNAWWPV